MTKRIIYENNDGGVSIVIPTIKDMKAVIKKSVPEGVSYEIINAEEIPSDRTFRNAWSKKGTALEVDMPKARIIHMDRIRRARNEMLKETDLELVLANEKGEDATTIKTKREKLRDIPQTFSLEKAQTPDALKKLWPSDLARED